MTDLSATGLEAALGALGTESARSEVLAALSAEIGDQAAAKILPAVAALIEEAWGFCPECDPYTKAFEGEAK